MTLTTPTLPVGAAAHALERARIAELRRAITTGIAADLALFNRLGEIAPARPAGATASHQDGGRSA